MALHWWTNFGAEKCRNGVPGCDGKPPVAEPDRKKEESQRGSGGRSPRRVRAEPCLPNDLVGKLLSTQGTDSLLIEDLGEVGPVVGGFEASHCCSGQKPARFLNKVDPHFGLRLQVSEAAS